MLARAVEAQCLEDRNTEPVRRQAIIASTADGAKERRAKKADEQEVVEVPGLQRCILAVVAEAEHLSARGRHAGFGLAVHPTEHRVRQQSGCRGAPLSGQGGEPVVVLALSGVQGLARQAKAELARDEPGAVPAAEGASRRHGDSLGLVFACISLQAKIVVLVLFQPCIGIVLIAPRELQRAAWRIEHDEPVLGAIRR